MTSHQKSCFPSSFQHDIPAWSPPGGRPGVCPRWRRRHLIKELFLPLSFDMHRKHVQCLRIEERARVQPPGKKKKFGNKISSWYLWLLCNFPSAWLGRGRGRKQNGTNKSCHSCDLLVFFHFFLWAKVFPTGMKNRTRILVGANFGTDPARGNFCGRRICLSGRGRFEGRSLTNWSLLWCKWSQFGLIARKQHKKDGIWNVGCSNVGSFYYGLQVVLNKIISYNLFKKFKVISRTDFNFNMTRTIRRLN